MAPSRIDHRHLGLHTPVAGGYGFVFVSYHYANQAMLEVRSSGE